MGHFFFQKSKEHNKAQNCGFKKAIWKVEEGPRAFIKAMPDLVKNKNEIFEVADMHIEIHFTFTTNAILEKLWELPWGFILMYQACILQDLAIPHLRASFLE